MNYSIVMNPTNMAALRLLGVEFPIMDFNLREEGDSRVYIVNDVDIMREGEYGAHRAYMRMDGKFISYTHMPPIDDLSRFIKLPLDFKTRWLAALRSGEIIQGHRELRNPDNTYCCLGVACLVAGYEPDDIRGSNFNQIDGYSRVPDVLYFNKNGRFKSISATLQNMNDTKGNTFNEIADWIEENL